MFSSGIMKIDQKLIRALLKAGFPLTSVAKALSELDVVVPMKDFKKMFPNSVWVNGELYLQPTLESAFNALPLLILRDVNVDRLARIFCHCQSLPSANRRLRPEFDYCRTHQKALSHAS
jgi:hypothetical protein